MWDLTASVPDHCLSFYFLFHGRFSELSLYRWTYLFGGTNSLENCIVDSFVFSGVIRVVLS